VTRSSLRYRIAQKSLRALALCQPRQGERHQECVVEHVVYEEGDTAASSRKKTKCIDLVIYTLKGLLEAWSPVLSRRLASHWCNDVGTIRITVDEFSAQTLQLFMNFMYEGDVHSDQLDSAQVLELARLGQFYNVDELQELCMLLLEDDTRSESESDWPSLEDVPKQQLRNNYPSADIFKRAGFQLHHLRALGNDPRLLVEAGFTLDEFMEAGYRARGLFEAGFSVDQVRTKGITANSLRLQHWKWKEIVRVGYNVKDLKEAGCTRTDFMALGYTAQYLQDNGFSLGDFCSLGYPERMLRHKLNYSEAELATAG
jgi:hypothetical protein